MIASVERIDAKIEAMADGGSGSGMGSGGMVSKIAAARIATAAGAHLAIASGHVMNPLAALADTGHGTVFVAREGRAGAQGLAGRRPHRQAGDPYRRRRGARAGRRQEPARGGRGAGRRQVPRAAIWSRSAARTASRWRAASPNMTPTDAALITGKRSDALAAILGYAPRAAWSIATIWRCCEPDRAHRRHRLCRQAG